METIENKMGNLQWLMERVELKIHRKIAEAKDEEERTPAYTN